VIHRASILQKFVDIDHAYWNRWKVLNADKKYPSECLRLGYAFQ
jgi:hypothetical protein